MNHTPFTEEMKARTIELYEKGLGHATVARLINQEFNLVTSYHKVRKVLLEAGVTQRPKYERVKMTKEERKSIEKLGKYAGLK